MEQAQSRDFLDAAKVVGSQAWEAAPMRELSLSRVIDADRVVLVAEPAAPPWGGKKETGGGITVDVVRDGNRIAGLRIVCACGRHAELDVEYAEGGTGA